MTGRIVTKDVVRASMRLPKPTFPMRANAAAREPTALQRLTDVLYRRQLAARQGQRDFVLHDGPPYANGDVHMGHLLNKVLKDVFNRHALVSGRRVVYVPGWDCHGLPIELKALESLKAAGAGEASEHSQWLDRGMDPADIISEAGRTARKALARQAKDFRRWGIMADWGVDKATAGEADEAGKGGAGAAGAVAVASKKKSKKKSKKRPWLSDAEVYRTLDPKYEEAQLRLFADMVRRGCIQRGLKPVYWSPSSGTALAEAELEYADNHRSTAIYVSFPVEEASLADFVQAAAEGGLGADSLPSLERSQQLRELLQGASFVAWTTTPWTIPSNVALALSAELEYVVVLSPAGQRMVVGSQLFASGQVPAALSAAHRTAAAAGGGDSAADRLNGIDPCTGWSVLGSFRGSELAFGAVRCQHPLALAGAQAEVPSAGCRGGQAFDRCSPVITATHVTADGGTGVVHTAPGHGQEDFAAVQSVAQRAREGRAHRSLAELETICPVDAEGKYVPDTGLGLGGLRVQAEGNEAVLALLEASGALLASADHLHRYPYDWRTKQPILIRATEQWFASVDGVKEEALEALESVRFTPAAGRTRLRATVQARAEWCISRQRNWGVPIPALFDAQTGEAMMTPEWVEHVAELIGRHGSRVWFDRPVEELLPARESFPELWTCPDGSPRQWVKSTDTLDVWFDSGASWVAAWAGREALRQGVAPTGASSTFAEVPMADMVLEGSDQHRGWFQSSLLTRVAAQHAAAADGATGGTPAAPPRAPTAPYAEVLTHGFALDGNGVKMSKSLGNVVVPGDIIDGKKKGANAKGSGKKQQPTGTASSSGASDDDWSTPYGADVARYWAAASDWRKDVLLSPVIVQKSAENLRKLRNVMRFSLGALEGCLDHSAAAAGASSLADAWSLPAEALVPTGASLSPLDRLMLDRLHRLRHDVMLAYEQRDTARVLALLAQFAAADLSGLFIDTAKDSLYADEASDLRRQVCQAILFEALRTMTLCVAPICPFTAEDIFQHSAEPLGLASSGVDLLRAPAGGRGDEADTVFDVQWEAMHEAALDAERAAAGGDGPREAAAPPCDKRADLSGGQVNEQPAPHEPSPAAARSDAETAMAPMIRIRDAVSACAEALRTAPDSGINTALECEAVIIFHGEPAPAGGAAIAETLHQMVQARQLADFLRVSAATVGVAADGGALARQTLIDGDMQDKPPNWAPASAAHIDPSALPPALLEECRRFASVGGVEVSEPVGLAAVSLADSAGAAVITLVQPAAEHGGQAAPLAASVVLRPARGSKCGRCWKVLPTAALEVAHSTMEGADGTVVGLCNRCSSVLASSQDK